MEAGAAGTARATAPSPKRCSAPDSPRSSLIFSRARRKHATKPERLDLDAAACRCALALGATLVIDTDAHSLAELRFMRWGVDQARRGWVDAAHVANTWPLQRLLRSLRRAHKAAAA